MTGPAFPRRFDPGDRDGYLRALACWIASDEIGWLIENIPAYPDKETDPVLLTRPAGLERDDPLTAIWRLDEMCDWRKHGTGWDTRTTVWSPTLGRERPFVTESLASGSLADRVIAKATSLGMRTDAPPTAGEHDAFVALGGARMAPLMRTRLLAEHANPPPRDIVLLGAPRSALEDFETPGVAEYAPGAQTEFDLMVAAGRSELRIAGKPTVEVGEAESVFDGWCWWRWNRPQAIHAVSAPTSTPGRRADTGGSLAFVAGGVDAVLPHNPAVAAAVDGIAVRGLELVDAKVVVSTSAIYLFQGIEAVRVLGVERECEVELATFPIDWNPARGVPSLRTATNYMQETRSIFQAALRLADAVAATR